MCTLATRHAVSPTFIDNLSESMNIAISLRYRDLRLLHITTKLFFEDEQALLSERCADGKIDATVPCIVLVRVEIAPVATTAIQIHERSHRLDSENSSKARDDLTICWRGPQEFLRAETEMS
jgi:hypothetical protein